MKDQLARTQALCVETATVALQRAYAETDVPLPGYTHLQRAVVSSLGMWWAGWVEAFIDNAARARDTQAWIDANPMGTAAGDGVNLPLPRGTDTASFLIALRRACDAIRAFAPGALVVALGLDAHERDPYKAFAVTTEGFAEITAEIARLGLPTVLVQEGGYLSDDLGPNLASALRGFDGAV